MNNQRWEKRILRATRSKNLGESTSPELGSEDFSFKITDNGRVVMHNQVRKNEKLMKYLQKENASGYETNMDMLACSVNALQHMREAILGASFIVDLESNKYVIKFPFGEKMVTFTLSAKAVESE